MPYFLNSNYIFLNLFFNFFYSVLPKSAVNLEGTQWKLTSSASMNFQPGPSKSDLIIGLLVEPINITSNIKLNFTNIINLWVIINLTILKAYNIEPTPEISRSSA